MYKTMNTSRKSTTIDDINSDISNRLKNFDQQVNTINNVNDNDNGKNGKLKQGINGGRRSSIHRGRRRVSSKRMSRKSRKSRKSRNTRRR